MKQAFLICGVVALAALEPASAQEALGARGFVPIELDQQHAQALTNALGEIPLKYSLPIYNFISREEDRAIIVERQKEARKAQEAAKAAADAKGHHAAPPAASGPYTPRPPASVAPMLAHPPVPPLAP